MSCWVSSAGSSQYLAAFRLGVSRIHRNYDMKQVSERNNAQLLFQAHNKLQQQTLGTLGLLGSLAS